VVSSSSRVVKAPAPLLFLAGGLSMYFGAALAVVLFAQVGPSSVAWLRMMGCRGRARGVAAAVAS
jgi:inner membrane transporter RhtA